MKVYSIQEVLENTKQKLAEVTDERDAVLMLLAEIRADSSDFRGAGGHSSRAETFARLCSLIHSIPTKRGLLALKAEAGRAGFIEGASMWSDYAGKSQHKLDYLTDIEADASAYVDRLRKEAIT